MYPHEPSIIFLISLTKVVQKNGGVAAKVISCVGNPLIHGVEPNQPKRNVRQTSPFD